MKCKDLFILIISASSLLLISSCNSQTKTSTSNNTSNNSGNSPKMNTESTKYIAGKDYTEFVRARILDKVGFQQPVEAFSLLIPQNWKFDGDIMWNPPGSTCAGNNLKMKAVSPDGKYSFEMLPNYMWSFISDPQLAQFMQQQQYPKYCSFGEPMNADAYFKNVFIPNELRNPKIVSIKESSSGVESLKENGEKSRQEMIHYGASQVNFYPSGINANVKWDNGSEAIVLCGVIIMETTIPNNYNGTYSKSFTSVASERVVFMYPAGEYGKAASMLSVVMGSIRTNPSWKNTVDNFWREVREQSNRVNIGRISMIDEQTRHMGENAIKKGNANLNAMDANMRSWEASQQSQDRIHTNFIKTIREVENYRDETGKVEMVSGYNHAWSRSDGSSFIMSDNPNFDPSSVFQDQRWKEMKKVDN
ncbi:hypothetical protein [Mariniflexile sp.]|uniref:hypothetical protein n=1 Tax=Mariniflexile sp. TaxID=1979402 RepID=UPI0040484271